MVAGGGSGLEAKVGANECPVAIEAKFIIGGVPGFIADIAPEVANEAAVFIADIAPEVVAGLDPEVFANRAPVVTDESTKLNEFNDGTVPVVIEVEARAGAGANGNPVAIVDEAPVLPPWNKVSIDWSCISISGGTTTPLIGMLV
ncbi:uncharacterized protein PGTG_01947 [Puccinia graminis f. sp. tritici CRL 75-36-700-3]|uniref:Uncharacterized protein n=1 Tax=Puccinia graminis f. sp. tritici (strain CRL 75-36-700-3 / race SCCL) TaxID=418459 RepID=E3JT75_PUCGT|nr:uncharacterized protein PGTG_01947 [Puccinia graminis f. sp. tritici CRL 75-36-700-3]EFP75354.1 hypothetical protein PGTG_01947 [Puccinia graminis f. sp. tritici CRL 75-36-700-3]